jgi:hypothetical protein
VFLHGITGTFASGVVEATALGPTLGSIDALGNGDGEAGTARSFDGSTAGFEG